jgi:two-component system, chemotaxis family, chemotaxis protein CheY
MGKVLVVDDDSVLLLIIKRILEVIGFKNILQASHGVDALEVLRSHNDVAIIITDIHMPEMDGFGLLMAIKANRELRGIPVLMLTSLTRPEDQRRALKLGAAQYLSKSSNPEVLAETITEALQSPFVHSAT